MKVRPYQTADCTALATIFTESVHRLARGYYTKAQLNAWAPVPPDLLQWQKRFESLHTLVAKCGAESGGFISFEPSGHIDLLYTNPAFARRGIARRLYGEAQSQLIAAGVSEAFTEASLAAQPFFASVGFHVVEEQSVVSRGSGFRRLAMRKSLRAA